MAIAPDSIRDVKGSIVEVTAILGLNALCVSSKACPKHATDEEECEIVGHSGR